MCISAKIPPPSFRWLPSLYNSSAVLSSMSRPSAPLSLCARKNPLEVAFLVLFWRTKKNEAFVLQYLPSDKKIFRVLTGSCRGGIMESRRGEKTFKSILRRQGERTTATRFSQYPPLSLRNEAEQRRAIEKYFCQTEHARSLPLIIRLVGSTPHTKVSSTPPLVLTPHSLGQPIGRGAPPTAAPRSLGRRGKHAPTGRRPRRRAAVCPYGKTDIQITSENP